MFFLTHCGDKIGSSNLESGDPSILAVSGAFNNIGGAKPLAAWIQSIGGAEDDGVVYVNLNQDFALTNDDGVAVNFAEGSLIAIPADDEVYLDLTGVPESDYKIHFSAHLHALSNES